MAAVGDVDVEVLLIGWLQQRLGPGVVVRDELDNNLLNELPTVQVQRAGGGDDGFRLDRPVVDTNAYATSRGAALALCQQVRRLLLTELRGSKAGPAVVGYITTISAPTVRPYENLALRRAGATYQMHIHPVS
ncbi:hypothetical protein H3146_07275 [Streptomyces sp. OF3]|uniref:DUF3168 domain-containing protein n=1 Tax=Streptomyces alkaliterrae TaxID=2213162 RepID=A0A7W3WIW7_9ACTN|nr:hypothetical protein [Streptomyces alkaliterrae]MBB1253171.1 hypothetical protein [Streptomyces alkaliterrae]